MVETHTDWLVSTSETPCFRMRVNVGRNSGGVTFDTTIEMTWSGTPDTYYLNGEERSVDAALAEIRDRVRDDLAERIATARAVDTFVPKPER
jgi:hypothetical protein